MNLNEALNTLEKAGYICEVGTTGLMQKLRNFIHNYRLTKYKVSVAQLQQWVKESMQDKMKERPCASILDYLYDLTKNPKFDPSKDNEDTVDMFYDWEDIIDDYFEEWYQEQ